MGRHPFLPTPSRREAALLEEVDSYLDFWQQFVARRSLCHHRRDWQEWVAGRGPILLLVARVPPESGLAARAALVQRALRGVPSLELHPLHFLHLTIQMLGFLPRWGVRSGEEVNDGRLWQAVELLRRALSRYPAFPIAIGGANSFFSCPFLETYHGGHLGRLRKLIRDVVPWVREVDPWEGYAFHLTIGYYGAAADHSAAVAALGPLRAVHLGLLWVRTVDLVAVETQSGEPYPPLLTLARFPLAPALAPRPASAPVRDHLACPERSEVVMSLRQGHLAGVGNERSRTGSYRA